MNYLITGTATHSFNWYVCQCIRGPETLAWGGQVSITPSSWEINVAPLPPTTWLAAGAPTISEEGVWFSAIDGGGARALFEGTTVTYRYEAHHGDWWEASGTVAPVPEPSVVGLLLVGMAALLARRYHAV